MKLLVEIEYEQTEQDETFERTKEIVTGNIENSLGCTVLTIEKEK